MAGRSLSLTGVLASARSWRRSLRKTGVAAARSQTWLRQAVVVILLLGLSVRVSGEVLSGSDMAAGDLACVPASCLDLAPACGLLDDGCGGTIQCDCPPDAFGSCVGDPSTRVTVGYFPVATPLGDCFFQPRKCVPGEEAWRLVRAVTMENDYIQITFADGGGGKVFDFRRKVDLERDAPDWSGQSGGEAPATTDPDDPRYPPDRAGRRWLIRGGDEGQGGCDSRPSNPGLKKDGTPCTLSDPEPGCVPRCEWAYIWGDENYDPKDRTAGIETGTPHFVHNVIGTGTQFSVALRDRDESKETCMLGSNWNPNSMGGCDGSPNGGCRITAAPDCAYNEEACWTGPPCDPTYDFDEDGKVGIIDITEVANVWRSTDPEHLAAYDLNKDNVIDVIDVALVAAHYCSPQVDPIGDNCGIDRDRWTGEQIISLTGEPFRLREPTHPESGNAAEDHPEFPAPTVATVGPHRVYLRTGMWRSFGRPGNFEVPSSVDDPIYTDPNAPGYVGKAYWTNRFRWRVHAGGPFCRDAQGNACTCDPDPNNCTCCPGSYTSADPKEWFNIDASQGSFDARLTACPDGQALCNGWPKEPGWERPFPDQGYNREDVWAETYVCLQGPEAIFQVRLHHPADPVRHGDGHPMPAHAMPQAHARGLFDWAVYGDRGKIHKERIPLQSLPVPKKLFDSASDNWIGMLNEDEVYGLFLYQRFNLGVDAAGYSHGKIDRFTVRTSDREGNKVKMTSHSYKFTAPDSVLDLEYRYILATPDYVRRRAVCYNLGLPYPCGLEDVDYVGDDGPALWTWQHNLTEERWSRVGEQPPKPAECQPGEIGDGSTDCWFRLDFVDALIPLHDVRPGGTVDLYECVLNGSAGAEYYLAACPADDPECVQARGETGGQQAPCIGDSTRGETPIGRLLAQQGPEGRFLWNIGFKTKQNGDPKPGMEAYADTVNPSFHPEWEDPDQCGGQRCGYDPARDGVYLGFTPPGPVLAVWRSGQTFTVTTAGKPDANAIHVGDLGMLLGSAPEYGLNLDFDPLLPKPPPRTPVHRLYLCQDDTGGQMFVSREPGCSDAGAPAPKLLGYLGFAYSRPLLPGDHHFGNVVYSVEVFRCRHPDHGWSAVAGSADACSDLGAGWSADGSLGHLVPFSPAFQ